MKNNEYRTVLKGKLEQIKIDNKGIVDLINTLSCSDSYKNLFVIFLSNLRKFGISDYLYRKVERIIVDEFNVQRTVAEHECVFGASMMDREVCTFDEMMTTCFEENGVRFYEHALNHVIGQFRSSKDKGNAIDNFLNYAVIHNYDEVKYGMWDDANMENYYEATLYGYPLGKMFLETMQIEDREFFSPESLRIRKNLQGLKLGAFLLQKLMRDMVEKHPNEPLVSPTVLMSNVNALKLYNSLGAKVYVDGKIVEDPINGMDHSVRENCIVVFMPDAIRKYADTVIDKPIRKINNIKASMERDGR